ncbi:MAG: 3-isopropylmalate dehydratase small subunit [Candidatus Binatia bacterium]
MKLEGKAHKFGDDVNTGHIISGRFRAHTADIAELAEHTLEDLDPEFSRRVVKGDLIVAGRNFGCGSSREQAPRVIKHLGIGAILACSFARIFYRNAVALGIPIIECETEQIHAGDHLRIDLERGEVEDLTQNSTFRINPMPSFMWNIIQDGGLLAHIKKHGTFQMD